MDLLESIDRSYPEDQADDDIIENRQNASINFAMNFSFNSGSSSNNSANDSWRRNDQSNQGANQGGNSNRSFGSRQNVPNRGGGNAQVNNMATTQNFVNSTVANNSYDNDDNLDDHSNYSLPSTIHSNSVSVKNTVQQDSKFPFYTNGGLTIHNNTTETIVMSKDVTNENHELGVY